MIRKMADFIAACPLWPAGGSVTVDSTENSPGALGLFPGGVEELKSEQDILGNKRLTCRAVFTLYGTADDRDTASALVAGFSDWVQRQSARGLAPRFGDVPEKERLRAEKGGIARRESTGGFYSIQLTAEFMKIYEVNENGKN